MRTRLSFLPFLIVAFLSQFACTDQGALTATTRGPGGIPATYTYRAYNSAGDLLVLGTLRLVMDDSASIAGTWAMDQVHASDKIGPQVGTGKLGGMISGKSVWINLNPSWMDNNVFLQGTWEGDRISGRWTWSTFIGSTAEGTFEAMKKP